MAYRKWSTNSEEILLLYHKEFFIQITLMVFRDEIDLMNSKTLSQFLLKWKKKKKENQCVFPSNEQYRICHFKTKTTLLRT